MKFKMDLNEMKKGIMTLGKTIKKSALDAPLIKIEALDDNITLSSNGLIGISMKIPAEVTEAGEFVSTFSSINILSIRKCSGAVTAKPAGENGLLLKYKGNMANTALTRVQATFTDMPTPSDKAMKVSLPASSLKEMVKETVFVSEDNVNSDLHSLKIDITDDVDGLLKFVITACDGKSLAVRSAYAVKNGNYTGSILLLPEQFKVALDILGDDGNIDISIEDGKVFMSYENIHIYFPAVTRNFPDLSALINNKQCSFSVKMDKAEFIEALNCALYLHNEQKTAQGFENSVAISFAENTITVGCVGMSQYEEKITAETNGELPDTVFFNTALLKEIVGNYPSEQVVIGGTNTKSPFWLCCGEHDEYIYCVLPRVRK